MNVSWLCLSGMDSYKYNTRSARSDTCGKLFLRVFQQPAKRSECEGAGKQCNEDDDEHRKGNRHDGMIISAWDNEPSVNDTEQGVVEFQIVRMIRKHSETNKRRMGLLPESAGQGVALQNVWKTVGAPSLINRHNPSRHASQS